MPKQSALSKTIDTADQEAQYDASVKRLLSQKILLAWILKECVPEFKSFSILRRRRTGFFKTAITRRYGRSTPFGY